MADTKTAEGGGPRAQLVHGPLAMVATVGASAMASLDATIVNVALPHIGSDFDASVSQLQWVLTGYLLALASLILLGGALGDRFGRRRIFIIGTVWFAAASLLSGAAPNIDVLIARPDPAGRRRGVAHAREPRDHPGQLPRSTTAPRRLARGRGSAASPAPSGRSSAAGSSTVRAGAGRS